MGKRIPALEQAYQVLFVASLVVLAVFLVLSFLRAIMGPRVADRIVAVNMMGTITITMIAILAVMKQEGYLVDICLIYAMTSFLAVIVLCKVYMGVYRQRREGKEDEEESGHGGF